MIGKEKRHMRKDAEREEFDHVESGNRRNKPKAVGDEDDDEEEGGYRRGRGGRGDRGSRGQRGDRGHRGDRGNRGDRGRGRGGRETHNQGDHEFNKSSKFNKREDDPPVDHGEPRAERETHEAPKYVPEEKKVQHKEAKLGATVDYARLEDFF